MERVEMVPEWFTQEVAYISLAMFVFWFLAGLSIGYAWARHSRASLEEWMLLLEERTNLAMKKCDFAYILADQLQKHQAEAGKTPVGKEKKG